MARTNPADLFISGRLGFLVLNIASLQMFSSTNNINPFAQLPSSSYLSLPTSLTSQDSGDVFLHRHHDLLPGALVPVNPQITEYLISMPMVNSLNGGCFDDSGFLPQEKPVKKDRHSKICTAQGVRDRRVRLSIEIAREFFDLQDMLGFDKASKTLGWLLTKSKSAIKEVAKMKGIHSAPMSSSSKCEVVSEDGELGCTVPRRKALVGEKKMKRLQKASREMARARARERTREKMCTQRILKKFSETSPQILNQFKSHNILAQEVEELGSHLAARDEDIFLESVVIKRGMKTSAVLGYQQNPYFPYFPSNWDINNGEVGHSTISAVTNLNL